MAQTIKLKRSATQGAAPTTSNLELGEVAINTYDGKMYIKKNVGGTESIVQIGGSGSVSYLEAGMIEYEYTASSNQTTFSGSDSNSATLSYTANSIMVFLNGVLQDDGVDYTATNGTSVVFSSALTANDEVRIVAFTNVTNTSTLNNPTKLDAITTVNNQAAYSLTVNSSAYAPSSQNALIVSLNGITQEPGDSFTISGSTITFSPALVTGDVVDYIVDMGRTVTIGEYDSDLVVTGDITPGADSTYDLGASGTEWANVYADTFTGNLTGNVTGTVSSLSNHDTDDLSEGSTNLYFTTSRVDSHLSGGTGVTYNAGEISIGQDVSTTATPTFGNITTTGYIAGPSTFTIDPAAVGDNTGTLVVAGNLQVDGTTTTINSTTMTVDDLNITLASGAANAAAANGAGITVDGASATLTYNGTNDNWNFNKPLIATKLSSSEGVLELDDDGTHNGIINVPATLLINIDSDNNNTGESFRIAKDRTGTSGGTELFRVQEDGKVGIGTDAPAKTFTVNSGATSDIAQFGNDYNSFVIATPTNLVSFDLQSGSALRVRQGATQPFAIDTSGNMLVGTTQHRPATNNVDGVSIDSSVGIEVSITNGGPLTLNRKSSNGSIASFKKDGTTIGNIGSEGGDSIYIGNGDTGLKFSGGADAIQPFNTSTVASRDDAIDLGTSGARFGNLYMSGFISDGSNTGAKTFAVASGGVTSLRMQQARGTIASPTSSASGGDGTYIVGEVYNGSTFNAIGHIAIVTDNGGITDGNILFRTATSGTVSTKMHLDSDGSLYFPRNFDGSLAGGIQPTGNYGYRFFNAGGSQSAVEAMEGYLAFKTGGLTASEERMRIDTNGRTVIYGGVSYTANAPSVRGNLIIANAASNTTTTGGLEFMSNSGGGAGYGARISADSSGGIRFETRTNNSNWSQRVLFSSSGHVGIGVTDPTYYQLEVGKSSTGNATALRLYNDSDSASATVELGFSLERVGSNVKMLAGQIKAGKYGSWTTTPSTVDGYLAFTTIENETPVERIRIDYDGLKFNGDTSAVNALNDYEEGTWTPTTPNGSWSVSEATYTKIGRLVFCRARVQATSAISSADFSGLPFTVLNSYSAGSVGYQNSVSSTTFNVLVQANSHFNFRVGATQYGLNNGAQAMFSFVYETSD